MEYALIFSMAYQSNYELLQPLIRTRNLQHIWHWGSACIVLVATSEMRWGCERVPSGINSVGRLTYGGWWGGEEGH